MHPLLHRGPPKKFSGGYFAKTICMIFSRVCGFYSVLFFVECPPIYEKQLKNIDRRLC